MSNKVFHLVYISEAVEDISYSDIHDILNVSRKNNAMENITGILIFREGYFFQVLEGPEAAVRKVLGKIIIDDRNYNLRVLLETSDHSRLFENWSMAFYDGDISSNTTEDLVNLFELCVDPAKRTPRPLIMTMVKKFRSTARELR
ncbi:BLUF domain-containing protein [Bdellovibrio bacteriovorus]